MTKNHASLGNIRVFARERKKTNEEEGDHFVFDRETDDKQAITLCDKQRHQFSFDKVFPGGVTQPEVFAEISPAVVSALDGYGGLFATASLSRCLTGFD
jgi:hypothetical protein